MFIYKVSGHGYAFDYSSGTIADGCTTADGALDVQQCFTNGNIFPRKPMHMTREELNTIR
jgi:hypothetical protein